MISTNPAPKTIERYAEEFHRWQAVLRRDSDADGEFCYSVATTGVYCRPSCGARIPRRENVRFHDTPAHAERSGFRPCKRCRPNEDSTDLRNLGLVEQACRAIESADGVPALAELAMAAGMSAYHFHRIFKRTTGVTPKVYAAAYRIRQIKENLKGSFTITESIFASGFNSNSPFYATVSQQIGMTPSAYKSGGSGVTIRFAVGECSLGSLLVAATERGICAILLGDDPEPLVADLQNRFPSACIIGGESEFESVVAKAVGLVENPQTGVDLPLDIQGTAFQQRVWNALRHIPSGKTATYSEIARQIGQPGSSRAVAAACAANKIAVAIPCHRVVRMDDSLSGYRWGVERKAELLKRERESA